MQDPAQNSRDLRVLPISRRLDRHGANDLTAWVYQKRSVLDF